MTTVPSWLELARDESARLPDALLHGERNAALRQGIDRALRRRRKVRRGAFAGGVLALGALLLVARSVQQPVARSGNARSTTRSPASSGTASWSFADGSRASAREPVARLRIERDGADGTVVWLDAGAARFDIQPRNGKPFIVHAGSAEVQVVGTHFDVTHLAGGAVEVAVAEGHVRVLTAAGAALLHAGDRRVFAPAAAVPALAPVPPAARDGREATPAAARTAERSSGAHDEPGALLAAADLARRQGNTQAAAAALRKLVRLYADDPRAPSAAFSLGRVLLESQHSPEQAAAAFATARKLDPQGPLAEDALAREVEAWSSAGSLERARALAERYLQRYPGGPRSDFVRAHARLDQR